VGVFSEGQGDFDNEVSDSFEQNDDNGHLCEDGGTLQSAYFGFGKEAEVFFGSGVGSFGGGAQGFKFVMSIGASDDL